MDRDPPRPVPPGEAVASDPRAPAALYRLARFATSGDPAAAALPRLLEVFTATFHAEAGSIALLSADTGHLVTEVQIGRASPPADVRHELKPGHGITGWCALNRRALLVPDVTTEPRYIAVRTATRCEMAAPLLHEGQVIGVIDLESDRTAAFSPSDLSLLELLAGEAARVMHLLWRMEHLQDKARQRESLITTGLSLVTKLEPRELLDTLTHEARHMLQAACCALYLHDPARSTIRCASFQGEAARPPPTADLELSSCLAASPIHTRRLLWCADIRSPEYRELSDLPVDPALRSLLAIPLVIEGEVLGVLAIFTSQIHRFDNDERRLCQALASLGAVALQNARLYARVFHSEDILRKNERLTTLGLLAAEIAHEIRNPLTVLKLLHGGLGLDFPPGDPRRTDMRVISEKLDQLEAIVSRVLGFAKAPSGLHTPCSLVDIVQDTLLLVRLKFAQSQVSVSFAPPPQPLVVSVHKAQIQQVLLNLLLNATQAMPDGGSIAISLSSAPHADGSAAVLDVADTGTGVPEAIRERMFDSFLSGRPDGTGLGLAIAKRILVSHHGDITLLDTGPSGTTMRVTLPIVQ